MPRLPIKKEKDIMSLGIIENWQVPYGTSGGTFEAFGFLES